MRRVHSMKTSARRCGSVLPMAVAASLAALLGPFASPARAQFIINPSFGNSITSDANSASIISTINTAIATYQANISTPITVNIAFGEGGGLGGSSTFFGNVSYSSFLAALNSHASSADDATALSVLNPQGSAVNPVNGNATINVKTANLRALGFAVSPPSGQSFDGVTGQWDGRITLNTLLTTPGSPGSTLQYSLLSVTEHEIDEVLGLGSALPRSPNGTIFPEDLYRYDSGGARNYTTSGDNAWFSIDGTTDLVQFNNLNNGGDYGDWHTSATARVQDAFATPGASPSLGLELTALDVIGFNLSTPPAATPEPGSLALLAGLGITGSVFALRRRLRK